MHRKHLELYMVNSTIIWWCLGVKRKGSLKNRKGNTDVENYTTELM